MSQDVKFSGTKIYRSRAELEEVREFWVRTQFHPNTDFDHFLLVCDLRREVIGPCVISLWKNGNCRALVVARLERRTVRPQIGYVRLLGIPATALTILHSGIVGTLDDTGARDVAAAVIHLLAERHADMASVNLLPETEALWAALGAATMVSGIHGTAPRWSIHRDLILANEPGFLLRQMRSKHRAWIRRKEKDLEARFPDRVRWRWHSVMTPETLSDVCRRMELVARTTYQRGLGVGFMNDEETRARLNLLRERGQLRVLLLETDDLPKGFWLGEVYRGVFHSSATGYTPDVRDLEVGTLMLLRMVDELIREGVAKLDFGLGDAHYKERFADRAWREGSAQFFAPTVKGRLLWALIMLAEHVGTTLRTIVERFGLVDRVKRTWRRSVQKTSRPE
jgi:hypothetical protein